MKSIGIKLADGSFYPLLEEGNPDRKTIDLTTVMNNQKKVQVDVYRTETGSIEDAEYLDTLEITNLRPHQNGEPTLSLAIDVDENNELSAEIRDLETGKSSEFQVQLASRTMMKEGNKASDEKKVDGEDESNEFSDIAAAQAEKANEEAFDFDNIDESKDEIPSEDMNDPTFNLGNIDDINTENSSDNNPLLDLPDFDNLDTENEDTIKEGEVSIDMPDLDTPDTSIVETENGTDEFESLIDREVTEEDDKLILDSYENPSKYELEEESVNDETITNDFSDLSSLDDTREENNEDNTLNDLPSFDSIDEKNNEIDTSFDDLPSFDDLEVDTLGTDNSNSEDLFDTSDLNFEDTYDLPEDDTNFSLPDNLELPEEGKEQTSSTGFQMGNNMFTNLYDKETLEGRSSSYSSENETQKKIRTPVIICVVCAIICIIAVLLILLKIPSKLNFFTKKVQKEDVLSVQTIVTEEEDDDNKEEPVVEIVKEPEPIEAKEDEIVIAQSAKDVVPEPKNEVPKAKDIRYKIVWGDTLWDISNAYYKTPWKYKWLADYNKIPNPNHIVSGSWILIPAE